MVVIKLYGGLGNQMFQYAAGRALAEKKNCPLLYEGEYFRNPEKFGSQWNFQLNLLDTHISQWQPIYAHVFNFFMRLLNKFNLPFPKFYFEKNHSYRADFQTTSAIFLNGYFQSEKYFKTIREILLKEFNSKIPASGKNAQIIQKMKNSEAVALHIRRGDYISNATASKVHGTCDLNYYKKAVAQVQNKVSNPVFFIFSDDPEWVKENLKLDFESYYIDHNKSEQSYWDMLLMKNCKHNIIANSSFSWWGAWLNNNPTKMVFAPARWYADSSMNTQDLYPEEWIKVQ